MKTIGIIPARYHSSRIPGKPLLDLNGKPMVWWTYQHASKVNEFDELYIATDDTRIQTVCDEYGMSSIMTAPHHQTHIDRLHEVSEAVPADWYVCVCGDEPMVMPETIEKILPREPSRQGPAVTIMIRKLTIPEEISDPSNIKVYTDINGLCLALTRAVLPYVYGTGKDVAHKKIIGVERYNKEALDFFTGHPAGGWEHAEDIALLRFIEGHIPIYSVQSGEYQMSVDTLKDMQTVKNRMIKE